MKRFFSAFIFVPALLSCENTPPQCQLTWGDLFELQESIVIPSSEVREFVSAIGDPRWAHVQGISPERLRHGELSWDTNGNYGGFARLVAMDQLAAKELAFDPRVGSTPYWGGISRRLFAKGPGWRASATSLFYEIEVRNDVSGLYDSILSAPPSWRAARPPARGEFSIQNDGRFDNYLSSFSELTSLAIVADSVLVVHRSEGHRLPFRPRLGRAILADVFTHGRLLAWNLEAPGELFAYSRTSLFFLTHSEGESTISEFEWRSR